MDKRLKCNMTIWEQDELPKVATFYSDTLDDIQSQMRSWLDNQSATSARFTLMKRNPESPEGWKTLTKGVLNKISEVPEFLFTVPAKHEKQKYPWIKDNLILQTHTGRVAAVLPADTDMLGVVAVNLAMHAPSGTLQYKVIFLRLAGEDIALLQKGHHKELEKILEHNFVRPMADWYITHCSQSYNNLQ